MSSTTPPTTPPTNLLPPSQTNPQCKVCNSPDRFEIEVALARGQSQQSVATRFSRNGQTFSRQNVNTHYHKHMQVLELAVAEEAARRGVSPVLGIEMASEIHAEHERNRTRLRAQANALIEGGVAWKTRDLLYFMEQDIRLEEQRNQQRAEIVMIQARAYGEAVRAVINDNDTHIKILEMYDELLPRERDGQLDDFIYHDDAEDGGAEEA